MLRLHKWPLSPDEAPRKFPSAVEAARRAKTCGNLIFFHARGDVVICQPGVCGADVPVFTPASGRIWFSLWVELPAVLQNPSRSLPPVAYYPPCFDGSGL